MKTVHKSVLIWYSAEEMFALVTDVARYPEFLPWCDHAAVLSSDSQGMKAEVGIAFSGEGEQEIGTVTSVADPERAFCKVGDVIVKVDPRYYRPTEVETLLGDPTKAKEKLGWTPKTTLRELVAEMVEADYRSAKRDSLVKAAGFQAYDYNE